VAVGSAQAALSAATTALLQAERELKVDEDKIAAAMRN